MNINTMDQGLLKRNPAMTPEEFSHHWFTKHAPLVVPFFLHSGITHYEQMHGPLSSTTDIDPTTYDGAAGLPPPEALDAFAAGTDMPAWKAAYYRDVILADERRFLVSEALAHVRRVGPGTVRGERRVVIREGQCVVDVPGEVWRVWRAYEDRGGGQEEKRWEEEEEGGENREEEKGGKVDEIDKIEKVEEGEGKKRDRKDEK